MANRYLAQYLSTNGDGTGTVQAVGNYATAQDFYLQPAIDQVIAINRLIVYIQDAIAGGFNPALYGGMAALTNGITGGIYSASDDLLWAVTPSIPIKTNGQWMRLCFDVSKLDNNQNLALAVRWTFDRGIPKAHGQEGKTPIVLRDQQKLKLTLNDDFTGLQDHTFMLQGVILNAPANLATGV